MPTPGFLQDTKLITCIMPKGKARDLHIALQDQLNVTTGTFHFGRGVGKDARIYERGIGEQRECDVLEVVVPADRADEVFEFMFFEAEMNQPHGGMIYMANLPRSTPMMLPDVPREEAL